VEEGGAEEGLHSWFLDFLNQSQILRFFEKIFTPKPHLTPVGTVMSMPPIDVHEIKPEAPKWQLKLVSILCFIALVGSMIFGAWQIEKLFSHLEISKWVLILKEAGATLARVVIAVVVSALWTIPVGLWIGLSPRLSRISQPFVQVAASFPAPMLFSFAIIVMKLFGISLNWGAIILMLLGAQWYILFNVIAGAMAIPSDLLEAARMYRMRGWDLFSKVLMPGVFPYLVTGMVTSAGGTWNASIVAEYVTDKGQTLTAFGLGSQISISAAAADYPMLAASVVVMSLMVVVFNRLVWKRLYRLAEEKYSLSK
jgi:NitT/TauT family transport system permease protein